MKDYIRRNITIPRNLWEASKRKAGIIPLSAIIRRLLELWLEGKIGLD